MDGLDIRVYVAPGLVKWPKYTCDLTLRKMSDTPATGTKRGKKKSVAAESVAEAPVPAPKPAAKKKEKKPVKVVAVVTPSGIEGSFAPEPRRPLIAHLAVHSSEVFFQEQQPITEPEPYNPSTSDMFSDNQEVIQTPEPKQVADAESPSIYSGTGAAESRPMQCFAKVNLMVQFSEASQCKALPERTDVACFWCVHTFDWQPCIIPEREVNGTYNVYGNFCCPECAFSYLLQETMDPHVRWERIALLHRIYDREGRGRMNPAPGREVLKLFGGPLSIESFRATIRAGKVRIDTHMPPMVSILGSIDTKPIDFFDSSLRNTLLGSLQKENVVKAEEGLRLKRSKPLKDKESTLDSVMNIQIKTAKGSGAVGPLTIAA